MSDTPRTDAAERFMYYEPPLNGSHDYPQSPYRFAKPPIGYVPSELARELERELTVLSKLVK